MIFPSAVNTIFEEDSIAFVSATTASLVGILVLLGEAFLLASAALLLASAAFLLASAIASRIKRSIF
jgi:hypothetical protein